MKSALFFALLTASTASANPNLAFYLVWTPYNNFASPAETIMYLGNISDMDCRKACLENSQCKLAQYHDPSRECWLKSDVGTLQPQEGTYSYINRQSVDWKLK